MAVSPGTVAQPARVAARRNIKGFLMASTVADAGVAETRNARVDDRSLARTLPRSLQYAFLQRPCPRMQTTMRYNLTDLRLLVAIADAGNVSRGAAACFLAPSSASLRVKHLEEAMGVDLFV